MFRYIHAFIYIHVHMYIYIYIHIHIINRYVYIYKHILYNIYMYKARGVHLHRLEARGWWSPNSSKTGGAFWAKTFRSGFVLPHSWAILVVKGLQMHHSVFRCWIVYEFYMVWPLILGFIVCNWWFTVHTHPSILKCRPHSLFFLIYSWQPQWLLMLSQTRRCVRKLREKIHNSNGSTSCSIYLLFVFIDLI